MEHRLGTALKVGKEEREGKSTKVVRKFSAELLVSHHAKNLCSGGKCQGCIVGRTDGGRRSGFRELICNCVKRLSGRDSYQRKRKYEEEGSNTLGDMAHQGPSSRRHSKK